MSEATPAPTNPPPTNPPTIPPTKAEKRKKALFAIAALALIFGVIGVVVWRELVRRSSPILEVIPRRAAFVLVLDLTQLRRVPATREALDALTTAKIEARAKCATPLFAGIERLALTTPQGDELTSDFALVGAGAWLRRDDVIACAEGVVRERGGEARTSTHGSFALVQEGDGSKGVLAVRDGGPIVIGRGAWLLEVLDTADRTLPSIAGDPIHDLMREKSTDFATLSYAQPEPIRALLAAKLPEGAGALARIPWAFAGARLDEGANAIVVELSTACSGATCEDVRRLATGARAMLADDAVLQGAGLADALSQATIDKREDRVVLGWTIPLAKLKALLGAIGP